MSLIDHWFNMYQRTDLEDALEKDIVECLNSYVTKFNKLPNVVYIKDKGRVKRHLIKGPRFSIREGGDEVPMIAIFVGHTQDKATNSDGPSFGTEELTPPWSYNA